MPRPGNRSRTPSVDSVPRSSGEYNVVGQTEPVNQTSLTEPPTVTVSPRPPALPQERSTPIYTSSPIAIDAGDVLDLTASTANGTGGTSTPAPLVIPNPLEPRNGTLAAPLPTSPSSTKGPLRPPGGRFRASAIKIMQVARMSTSLQSPGAEQGIDPRRDSATARWGHIQRDCHIEVVEFSPAKATFTKFDNQELQEYLTGRGKDRPSWAKVRWIHVGGISWDVLSALALRYELHPLSIEDVLHYGQRSRTKSDYYGKHLFLQVICHSLAPEDAQPPSYSDAALSTSPTALTAPPFPNAPAPQSQAAQDGPERRPGWKLWNSFRSNRSNDPENGLSRFKSRDDIETTLGGEKKEERKDDSRHRGEPQWPDSSAFNSEAGMRKAANLATVYELKKGNQVNVELKHVYVFLTRGGTLITFHQDPDPNFFQPIMSRLRQRDTLLRSHCDASLLMQAVLDLIVDKALEVVDTYHDKLLDLERQILIKPSVKNVRQLHIMSGDLTLHKRTLTPLSTLIYALRRYDLDRAVASVADGTDEQKVAGFCSHQAKVYLADVYDHMEYILSSLEMFSSIAENLINFTFNVVSYETNTVMKRLTITTIIFFPLTFLTGYFGMNFNWMDSVKTHSEIMFWEIAFPVMFIIILCFTWNDLVKIVRRVKRNRMWKHFTLDAADATGHKQDTQGT